MLQRASVGVTLYRRSGVTLRTRSLNVRTNKDILVGGNDPSAQAPFMWWFGSDAGAGETAIGRFGE